MDFGEAVRGLHEGSRVARYSWDRGVLLKWLILVPSSTITVEADRPLGKAAPELVGFRAQYQEHIDAWDPINQSMSVWQPTQEDVLAKDWFVIGRLIVTPSA